VIFKSVVNDITEIVAASCYTTSESMHFSNQWNMLKAGVYGGNHLQKPTFGIPIVGGMGV
jgi:hypothetical protein